MTTSPASPIGAPKRSVRRRRDPEPEHEEGSGERWLLTYADMITLLLVLFIVLFALSKINEAKYRQFQASVSHTKFVGDSMVNGQTVVPSRGKAPLASTPDQLRQIEKALSKALSKVGLLGDVTLKINASGIVEGLVADSTFFTTDSAKLSPLGDRIVDTSGGVIRHYSNNVEVAGYTDDQPITGGPFADNWALSAARSTTVVERLTATDGVDPTQVIALGYGQYHPIAPNNSPSAEARNRRVNIVISPHSTHPGAPTA